MTRNRAAAALLLVPLFLLGSVHSLASNTLQSADAETELIIFLDPASSKFSKRAVIEDAARSGSSLNTLLGGPLSVRPVISRPPSPVEEQELLLPNPPAGALLFRYFVLKYASREQAVVASARLKSESVTKSVEHNSGAFVPSVQIPDDPLFGIPSNLSPLTPPITIDSNYQWGLYALHFPEAWDLNRGHARVGVLEGYGIQVDHPDLVDNFRDHLSMRFDNGQSYTQDVGENAFSARGHGTHVAGIIAARTSNFTDNGTNPAPNIGVAGTCWNCSLIVSMPAGGPATVAQSIKYLLDAGVQIINISGQVPGGPCLATPPTPQNLQSLICTVLFDAHDKGVLVVASSGNGRAAIDFPASHQFSIAVGGLQTTFSDSGHPMYSFWDGGLATSIPSAEGPFGSARGTEQALVAPALRVLSTFTEDARWDEFAVPNADLSCTDELVGSGPVGPQGTRGYGICTGTSMSAPFVSGIAGLMRSANPTGPVDTIRDLLKQSGSIWPNRSDTLGHGIPNARTAVEKALGGPGILNKTTPLFSFYTDPNLIDDPAHTAQGRSHFYTSIPQVALSAVRGTLFRKPMVSGKEFSTGSLHRSLGYPVAGYGFPTPLCYDLGSDGALSYSPCPLPQSPKAWLYIYSTHKSPGGGDLAPLYRLSRRCDEGAAGLQGCPGFSPPGFAPDRYIRYYYVTSRSEMIAKKNLGYRLEGIEGYVYSRNLPQPNGTVKVCRKGGALDDQVIFPGTAAGECNSAPFVSGGTYETNLDEVDFIGYAFANVGSTLDTDGDGMPDAVELFEGREKAVKDNDVFQSSRLFAMQQYRDFFAREGDVGGIDYYTNLINAGTLTRLNVIDAFFGSPEFQGLTAPIVRLYFAAFRRIPDYGGLLFQMNALRTGTPLSVIANNFALSPEFLATYGGLNNAQFVALLYTNILQRSGSQAEIDYHVNRLASGVTRGEVLVGFSESPEFVARIAHSVAVTMAYVGMIRRAPEQGGFDYWVAFLDAGNSISALTGGFLGSTEYRGRFLP